jgi:hypothetical protein
MDDMTQLEGNRHAGHKTSEAHASHARHAGHSVAMSRDKFWLSFALTIPVVFWSTDVQHWLGYRAPSFPGSNLIAPNPRNGGLRLRRPRFHPWGLERTGRPQARHDDPHQPGDHSCLWYFARGNVRPFRDRSLVGTRIADHDHGPRPLAGNASYFSGSWGAQCVSRAVAGHRRTYKRCGDSNRSAL